MFSLSFDQILKLSASGNTIPLYKQLENDILTPISCYLKLTKSSPEHSFLFESILGGEKIGRYSFLGSMPRKIIEFEENVDPILTIEKELASVKPVKVDGLPSFTGGAVGFISYDCVQYFEPTTKTNLNDPLGIPDAVMMLCDSIVIFDHLYSVIKICSNVIISDNASESEIKIAYDKAVNNIKDIEARLNHPETLFPIQEPILDKSDSVSNVGEQGYKDFVGEIKKSIVKGDVIQVVPSQRLKKKTNLHPFNAYRRLRTVNPSPYMFYVDLGDFQLVGASPEMLVKVEDDKVYMHPIAGTRKRGKTEEEDEALAKDLISDIKERSEHVMLVDLGRNDVNRVCDPTTVKVDSFMVIYYAYIAHRTICTCHAYSFTSFRDP